MPSHESDAAFLDLDEQELSRQWKAGGLRYCAAVNAYLERGNRTDWKDAGEEPEDTRQPMANAVLQSLRRANDSGEIDAFREKFPPAYDPFYPLLAENGQNFSAAFLLDDGRAIVRIGSSHQPGRVVIVHENRLEELPSEIIAVGRSPNRRYFAVAKPSGVTIHDGWEGPVIETLKWPDGPEGFPKSLKVAPLGRVPNVTQLIPFPQGNRVLLISSDGIFVLAKTGAVRLLPTWDEVRDDAEWIQNEHRTTTLPWDLSMEHGAVSPDGRLIATGHQSSKHLIFDAATYEIIGEIGHMSEYPHFAVFSADSGMVALNSCHFYWGITIGVPTNLLPGLKTEAYKADPRISTIEDGARVYCGCYRPDEFIVGDANGYLRAFDLKGQRRWQHFIGSTIDCIDISADGKRLVAASYAGFVCFLDLDTGESDPFGIGTATHRERRRWLFWKNEPKPLAW